MSDVGDLHTTRRSTMTKRIALVLGVAVALIAGAVAAAAQSSADDPGGNEGPAGVTVELVETGGFFLDDEFDMEELSPELIEELNAETEALVEHLRELGFAVDLESGPDGLLEPVFDEKDDALWKAIDDFYAEQFAAEAATWSDEEKAAWNAEIEEFVAMLAEDGITVETTEIAPGVIDIVWTEDLEMGFWELEGEFEDEKGDDDRDESER
jgi:hypothetical protein